VAAYIITGSLLVYTCGIVRNQTKLGNVHSLTWSDSIIMKITAFVV